MNIILIQNSLPQEIVKQLQEEFPQYEFQCISKEEMNFMSPRDAKRVEILNGSYLTPKNLENFQQLRWIHSPTSFTHDLCMKEIEEKGSIIVSVTKGLHVDQMAEFAFAGILAFSKHLIVWNEANKHIEQIWDMPEKQSVWTLRNRTLLVVGLGKLGSEVARLAKEFGLYTIGIHNTASFHPYCQKVLTFETLNSALPHADIVCLTLPHGEVNRCHFAEKEFKLMKNDSVFIVLSANAIDDEALAHFANQNKFRGVLIDSHKHLSLPQSSPLWQNPHVIVTPDIATYPRTSEHNLFRLFRFNLRQFTHGNLTEMRNITNMETVSF